MACGKLTGVRRYLKVAALALFLLYVILTTGAWIVMHQSLDGFSRVMAHVPGPMFMVLPFETLWLSARSGRLQVGDAAPDFDLPSIDKSSRVHLADDHGRPVVLIFGSYT